MASDDEEDTNMNAESPVSIKAAPSQDTADSPATAASESASPAAASKNNGDDADSNGKSKSKSKNKSSAKKKTPSKSPSKSKGTSKPYADLVHEAIVAMKDRTGSSQIAIMKHIQCNYPKIEANTSQNQFKYNVLKALKDGVKRGRFEKVKASYKISADRKKEEANKRKRKKALEMKKKKDREKDKKKKQEEQKKEQKDPVQAKIDELREKDPDSEELKKLLAEQKRKEEAEARKKYIAERLKKRRFPIEDTKLHEEDKELGVKPPQDVTKRADLSHFFSLTHNEQRRSNKSYAAAASKCEGLEKGSRGLVSDLLQVYHFFRGDVQYMGTGEDTTDKEIVPAFSLKHLIHAVDDVLNGTAKKSRMVPPLLVHLFVTCLQILTAPPDSDGGSLDDSKQRRQLQQDFATHLNAALSPMSWADVCFMYMDALDRHMTTEASLEKNVLPGLPIDAEYLLGLKDEESEMPETSLPEGYYGYLGDREGVLARAQVKLERTDPWLLTAEELMALLRALTDDILARKPEISEDISNREEKMHELLKAKRAADAKFRKVRLAYEGPKQKPRKAAATSSNADDNNKSGKENNEKTEENGTADDTKRMSLDDSNDNDDSKEKGDTAKIETEWKPTATKKQFEAARKAQLKASEAYEKGTRKLMARTEPVGYDRHHNAVYCFRHDPDVLYVEMIKASARSEIELPQDLRVTTSIWHVIEKKSEFDDFVQSLDVRGKRENLLHEELMGPQGAQQSLRRFLYDDIKERAEDNARLKEQEDLKRRLENAKLKCDEEEGRRSGRLASKAEEELGQIEDEINKLEQKIKSGAVTKEIDYEELTGLELLRKYDSVGKMETRRTREKKITATVNNFEPMDCSKLCSTGNIDGTGIMGLLVSKILELEENCESLAPWDRKDVTRQTWISDLENLVFAWNNASPSLVGPADASQLTSPRPSMEPMDATPSALASENSKAGKKRPSTGGFGSSDSKRSKTDGSAASSFPVSQAVHKLRQPLLDLEKRVFEITGLAMAAKDSAVADDNMSTSGEEENAEKESKEKRAWKKALNKLRSLPSKRHVMIREIVVEAIAAARKAQLKGVVGQLRTALLEFHPNAAGACKGAALNVLDMHGGYEADDDDEEEEEETNDDTPEGDEQETPSALSAEAVIANSSLDGIEDAGHVDWVDAVKSAKTLSRMSTLVTAFVHRATNKLDKIQEEHDSLMKALSIWEKDEERRLRNQAKAKGNTQKSKSAAAEPSEVWAHVHFTDEICMAKVEDYPWWPAKKCIAKDDNLESSLKAVGRCLVSLVGESGGIRVVETSAVREYTGQAVEEEDVDMSDVSKETRTQLEECMTMARRMRRGRAGKNGKKIVAEEKKMAT